MAPWQVNINRSQIATSNRSSSTFRSFTSFQWVDWILMCPLDLSNWQNLKHHTQSFVFELDITYTVLISSLDFFDQQHGDKSPKSFPLRSFLSCALSWWIYSISLIGNISIEISHHFSSNWRIINIVWLAYWLFWSRKFRETYDIFPSPSCHIPGVKTVSGTSATFPRASFSCWFTSALLETMTIEAKLWPWISWNIITE
jgi:hypothetical protein